MKPDNVISVLINSGNTNCDNVLFKYASQCAELGIRIWFILPEPLDKLPIDLPAEKEILQCITFMYVKDRLSLLKHMNGIHLWHKAPQLVILNKYEHYCKTQLDEHMFQVTAFTTSTILDAISACAKKNNISKAYLLICAQLDSRLRFVMNMYFNYILNHEEDLLKKFMNVLILNNDLLRLY